MASLDTFEPGLFNIDLQSARWGKDQYLTIKREELTYDLEIEPIYIKPVICNMLAVLSYHVDSDKTKAHTMLEELSKEYHNDLNILADLIHIRKNMDGQTGLNEYKEQIESFKNEPLLYARCTLGRAYALVNYLEGSSNRTSTALLKNINSIIQTYKMFKVIDKSLYEEQISVLATAIKKFEEGITILEDSNCAQEEILVWKLKLADTRVWMSRLEFLRDDGIDSDNYIRILEAYLEVIESLFPIEHLEEPLKVYLAYSYIALETECCILRDEIDLGYIAERFLSFLKSHDSEFMCSKVISMFPNNPKVLKCYVDYLIYKNRYLEAIDICNSSIGQCLDVSTNSYVFYLQRGVSCYLCSRELITKGSHRDQIKNYLQFAYFDMKLCLDSRYVEPSSRGNLMLSFAVSCLERAGPGCFHCKYTEEAQDSFKEMLDIPEVKNDFRIHANLGIFYLYISEYMKSIESLKTSLDLTQWSKDHGSLFLDISKCFMALYNGGNDEDLLSEFRFLLKIAEKRNRYQWIKDAMGMICQYKYRMLTDLIQNMIECDATGCAFIIEQILSDCMLQDMIEKSKQKQNFLYDYFVSHSQRDLRWIETMMLPNLEKLEDPLTLLHGCFPHRDFVPDENLIFKIIEGIERSRKLLVVLTPDYLKDNWKGYCSDMMILPVIEEKIKEKAIIPIVLEECDLPEKLRSFNPISFTEGCNWDELLVRLTGNIGPETEIFTLDHF